jgi:hypothetical protein
MNNQSNVRPVKKLALQKSTIRILNTEQTQAAIPGPTAIGC